MSDYYEHLAYASLLKNKVPILILILILNGQ